MGNFSRHTFDRLKHYVGVRLQQGVPILDADWNEQDDIRRFELQAFLKWFVGDGVPLGDDGFRILPSGVNDFGISAGRCLVEGWDAINDWDRRGSAEGRTYTSQRLYGNVDLATAWGVAPLPPLTTPGAPRIDIVYLDVWEREVGALEDPALVNPAIGIETSVRLKREWVVRVREGYTTLPDPPAGHVFYELATLVRRAGVDGITGEQITDRRRTGLTTMSRHDLQQITADAYGSDYSLGMDGQPSLKVSLREAVNALMRNQLPGTPPVQVSLGEGSFNTGGQYGLVDGTGAAWIFWTIGDSPAEIWCRRHDPVDGTWQDAERLAGSPGASGPLAAVYDGHGSIWAFWQGGTGGNYDIWYDRFDHAQGAWSGATKLTTGTDNKVNVNAIVDRNGNVWAFWRQMTDGSYSVRARRYDQASGTWGADTRLTTGIGQDDFHAAVTDADNGIWVFLSRTSGGAYDIWWTRLDPATSTWSTPARLMSDAATDLCPSAVLDSGGNVWVFWYSFRNPHAADIYCKRYDRATRTWGGEVQITANMGNNGLPAALAGKNNDLWVFWHSVQGETSAGWCKRYTPEGGWGSAIQVTSGPGHSWHPFGVMDAEEDIRVFWSYTFKETESIWHRKLVTEI